MYEEKKSTSFHITRVTVGKAAIKISDKQQVLNQACQIILALQNSILATAATCVTQG